MLLLSSWLKGFGQASAVANLKQNIVYIGLANPFIVVAEEYTCETLIVANDNGRLEKTEYPCQYDYLPEREGKATITIHAVKNGNTLLVGRHEFRVRKLPDPTARVAGRSSGSVSASELRVQIGMVASLGGFDINARFQVMEFSLIALKENGICISLSATSALFTDAMKEQFYLLKPKDRVIFANIKVRGPDGRIRSLTPIELVIE